MALKCSVCGKFLARGTAHDHDRDRQPDARHYNPHPPTDGNSLEDENPIIVPPRRRRSPMAARGSPGGGPGDSRPGLPSGPPSSERPGHGAPPPDEDDDEPEPDHDDGGLDSGIDRPKAKRKPPAADPGDDYDDAPPSTLSPLPPQYEDYSDPGEQEGADWRAWQPAPITPQAPMLDYEEYSPDFGAPAPITPQMPNFADLSEEYGEGTFDDTSKWWQNPESSLWLPQPHK